MFRAAPDRRVDPGCRPGPGTWAQDGYGPANTGFNPHASPPQATPTARWNHRFPEPLDELCVADGTVYCATRGRLVALSASPLVACDASSGDRLWERAVAPDAPLAVAEDTLYVGTDNGLVALA
jgi:outer membrane protein assembly factor BamB